MKNSVPTHVPQQPDQTNAFWKLMNSVVNVAFVLVISLPFLFLLGFTLRYRIILALLFLAYQLIVALSPKHIDLGDLVTGSRWIEKYPLKNHVIFTFLYSLSFSTFVVWVFFPFDLLIFNLLLIQLPFVLKTGYTPHAYLSGKMAGAH